MRILVLGGYGLIGRVVCRALVAAGHHVVGFGRSLAKGRAALPDIDWRTADLSTLLRTSDWTGYLRDINVVVNCAGVLQDGAGDHVARVQRDAMLALYAACEEAGVHRFVQISAPGVSKDADTAFYRTKAEADDALKRSGLGWTILRPGLVLARHAYGGASLIRMMAAIPGVLPIMHRDAPVQTVAVEDVAEAVRGAAEGRFDRLDIDLVEATPHRLIDIIVAYRRWLGWRPLETIAPVPVWMGRLVGRGADLFGWLGWRSALRTTSMKVLEDGVRGDASIWLRLEGRPLRSLEETLAAAPATAQDRLHAKAMLAFPILLGLLSAFWIVSGLIGFWRLSAAKAVFADAVSETAASFAVIGGGLADILIGALMLVRFFSRAALWASIGLSVAYLSGASFLTPHLWVDPLGPLVKVFCAIGLSGAVLILFPER